MAEGVVMVGLGISYTMAVVKRKDDIVVGECEVPLNLLLDQGQHALLLKLRAANHGGSDGCSGRVWKTKNAAGGLGIISVSLLASEN